MKARVGRHSAEGQVRLALAMIIHRNSNTDGHIRNVVSREVIKALVQREIVVGATCHRVQTIRERIDPTRRRNGSGAALILVGAFASWQMHASTIRSGFGVVAVWEFTA